MIADGRQFVRGDGSLDRQGIYRHVRRHLLEQGRCSTRPNVGCAYRGEGGAACAVGCLIPDERYSDDLEGKAAYYANFTPEMDVPRWPVLAAAFGADGVVGVVGVVGPGDRQFVSHLQRAHDKIKDEGDYGEQVRANLAQLARDWELQEEG